MILQMQNKGSFTDQSKNWRYQYILDKEVKNYLMRYVRKSKDSSSLSELVNTLVKKDIEISKKLAS